MTAALPTCEAAETDAAGRRLPLSAIILTFDEACNIEDCLDCLGWVDDVIIVDSGSADQTIQIVRRVRPDARVYTHPFRDFGDQRNWAIDEAEPKHEWILFIDADERCTADCAAAIRAATQDPNGHVGFYLTYRNIFLGRWIRRCTLFPSWQLRLLKHGSVRYRKEGHGQREVTDGPLGYIHEPYDHYGFSKGIAHWIERHNAYSTNEAELIGRLRSERIAPWDLFCRDPIRRRRCLKRLASRVRWFRPVVRFVYLYIFRLGFLDGRAGLVFCLLRFAHEIHIMAKLAETRHLNCEDPDATVKVEASPRRLVSKPR